MDVKDKSENIELHYISTKNNMLAGIEEYHEISENVVELPCSPKSFESPSNHDFFTKSIRDPDSRGSDKKKESQNKTSLMDIINLDIKSSVIPITTTQMTRINYSIDLQNSYLMKSRSIFKYFTSYFRKSNKSRATSFSPIFPKVLENAFGIDKNIPIEYIQPVLFEDLIRDRSQSGKDEKTKLLDVELRNITFHHHYEYTLEKILANKLIILFNEYERNKKILDELKKEIRVNRETKENLKNDFVNVNKREDLRFDPTIRQYTGKLLHSKEKYKEMVKHEKELKHKILSLWLDIEMIREKSKIIQTPYVVEIKTIVLDNDKFEQKWNDTFDSEFVDLLCKLEFEYVSKYLEYKSAKNEQKLQGVEKKTLIKPKLFIDDNALRKEVEHVVNNLVKKEQICLELKRDENILTQLTELRKTFEYHFQVYVDDIFVCESEHHIIANENLDVEFTEAFSVEIVSSNEKLTIILFENRVRVSRVNIKLISIKNNFDYCKLITVNFVYDKDINSTKEKADYVCGIKDIAAAYKVRLKSSNIFNDPLYTNCDVDVKIGWQKTVETQNDKLKDSLEIGKYLSRLMNGTIKPDVDTFKDIIGKLYGRDVSDDENLTKTLRIIVKSNIRDVDIFPLNENSPEFQRFKLLNIRNKGGFNNMDNKIIPLLTNEISTEQLNCLQKEKEKNFDLNYLSQQQIEMEPIEIQRFIGFKYIQKLNNNILRNLNEHLMRKTYKDVVRDFSDWSNLFSRSNTEVMWRNSKNFMLKESLNEEQEIQINVMRAFNLLKRSHDDSDLECDRIAGFKVHPLRPFVRVSYHGTTSQTCTAIGCHPTWNHTLKIKSKLEPLVTLNINIYDECKVMINDGYSDDDQHSRTMLYRYYNKWLGTVQIPLYTVLSQGFLKGIFKIASPPTIFGYETVQNKESNSFIPEIDQLLKKEVSYIALSITTSLSALGGLQNYNLPLEDDYIIRHLNNYTMKFTNDFPNRSILLTYIDSSGKNKCVTQFLQPIPMPSKNFFPKNPKSCESAVSKSSGFSRSSSSRSNRERRENVGEVDLEKDGSPNQGWSSSSIFEMVNVCLRYVALVPTYEVTESHNVVLTGLELLRVSHGSPLDHSLLLASYFLHFGIKCWIASGLGLPRGPTSYVLIQYDLTMHRFVQITDRLYKSKGLLNKNDGYIWHVCDAVSGERFELRDAGCPLKAVYFLFDEENIWVNVQSSQNIESVSFDLSRSSDWEAVFDRTIFVMRNPAVLDSNFNSSPSNVESLRLFIENKIKLKVQKWRSHLKTIWNRHCSGILRDTLPYWEYWAFNPFEPKPGPNQKLKQLMATYQIFGFPLNMPFVNTRSVVSRVKATSLHLNDDPSVEFALAVEVFSYPNKVLSVWVFFASISRF